MSECLDYNIIMTSWADIVERIVLPRLLDGTEDRAKVEKLREVLLNEILQNGRLECILKKTEV